MGLLTDGLLMAATLFAGGYCWVLSRRVADLKSLDKGLGGSIVTLTRQVELARKTLDDAQASAGDNRDELEQLVKRANIATSQLKIAVAAAREIDLRIPVAEEMPVARSAQGPAAPEVAPPAGPEQPAPGTAPATASASLAAPAGRAPVESADGPEPLRVADVLAPRGETAVRATLKAPPPLAPARIPDIPAILSESDAAAASDWNASRPDPAARDLPEIPKPSALPPMASPLRSRLDAEEPASETDIIEALSLLAAGGSR